MIFSSCPSCRRGSLSSAGLNGESRMNRRQLQKLGVPPKFAAAAIDALRDAASQDLGFGLKGKRAKELVQDVVRAPQTFVNDPVWGKLASEMLGYEPIEPREPISY